MNRTKKMSGFNNVAAASTTIAGLPVGLSYRAILLRCIANGVDMTKALVASDIDEIRLVLDGKTIRQFSGAELVAMLDYYGVAWQDGVLPLLFSDTRMRTQLGEDALTLGTQDVQTLAVEVDINAAAISPGLDVYAIQGPAELLGTIITVNRFSGYTSAAAGEFHISDLPRGPYGCFAMHLNTALITDVTVEANQRVVIEEDVAIANAKAKQAGRTPQTGYTHIDFNLSNRVADVLTLDLQEFRLKLAMSAGATFTVLMERAENRSANAKAISRAAA